MRTAAVHPALGESAEKAPCADLDLKVVKSHWGTQLFQLRLEKEPETSFPESEHWLDSGVLGRARKPPNPSKQTKPKRIILDLHGLSGLRFHSYVISERKQLQCQP